jgi:hypothetical protein
MHTMTERDYVKLGKLISLALCPSAAVGEWQNAASAFFAILRRNNIGTDQVRISSTAAGWSRPTAPPPQPPPPREPCYMPFGKYRGVSITQVPDSYLRWFITLKGIDPALRALIRNILDDGRYQTRKET